MSQARYDTALPLSGERFTARYRIAAETPAAAEEAARALSVEQTIEFPAELVEGTIAREVVARVESLQETAPGVYAAELSFAIELVGGELTQLLNVFFGNSSLLPNVRLERIGLSPGLARRFPGPRYGSRGLRRVLDVPAGPLLSTALKPLGLGPEELAAMAYRLALGGVQLIKDDHGLADQAFAPFEARLEAVTAAVARAERESGMKAVYAPNVTAPGEETLRRARLAREAGAGAVMVAPGLVGFDRMERLAREVGLPVLSHPAFLGGFVPKGDGGVAHYALFGQLQRLAGADVVIFPNYGGRFAFRREECAAINAGLKDELAGLAPAFPAPGGGMSLERVPEMRELYGDDLVFLIGGALHRRGPDLTENARHFRRLAAEVK